MKVVVDTNVLYPLRDALSPEHVSETLRSFLRRLADRGGVLVLPETVVLEMRRHQCEALQRRRDRLSNAYALLADHGVALPEANWDESLIAPDLIELLEGAGGIEVQTVEPTEAQLREAHRRACLRLEPHSGGGKGAEMRDLVIWCIALEAARDDVGAILLSEDQLFTGQPGHREAAEANLLHVSTFDAALEALGVDGPAEATIRAALVSVWSAVRASGLDAPDVRSLDIDPVSFRAGDRGLVMTGSVRLRPEVDGRDFTSGVTLTLDGSRLQRVLLEGINLDGAPWESGTLDLQVDVETQLTVPDHAAQREYLLHLTTDSDTP